MDLSNWYFIHNTTELQQQSILNLSSKRKYDIQFYIFKVTLCIKISHLQIYVLKR